MNSTNILTRTARRGLSNESRSALLQPSVDGVRKFIEQGSSKNWAKTVTQSSPAKLAQSRRAQLRSALRSNTT